MYKEQKGIELESAKPLFFSPPAPVEEQLFEMQIPPLPGVYQHKH